MGHKFHRGFTAAEKTELWDRWKRGESLRRLDALLVSRHRRSIFWWLRLVGFVLPSGVVQAGIDARGTRGDLQRRYGTSIGTIDRQVAWPLTLDGLPGNEPQWRL